MEGNRVSESFIINLLLHTLTVDKVNKANVDRNIRSWLLIPVGIIVILLVCFAVDSLIGLSSVSFPASVAVMILLFAGLILLELVAGERRTRKVVAIIDVPV